jgi:hypothetical protein
MGAIISRCCKDDLYIEQGYYVCRNCNFACDTIMSRTQDKECQDDTRGASEIEEFACTA